LLKGNIKTLTIKRTKTNKWYACFSVEEKDTGSVTATVDSDSCGVSGEVVGIDLGLTTFAVFSDGTMVEKPRHLIRSERRLKRLYRQLSRKKKGSNNRRKARLRLARLHEKIAFQREDWLHKLSREVVDRYGLIAVEKLNVSGMLHNHHLAKHISDASWHQFIDMISYKAESAGSMVVSVKANDTSQICCQCGTIVPKDLSDRVHDCPVCGLELDRDVNAAVNILNRGLCTAGLAGNDACGDSVRPTNQHTVDESAVVVEAGTTCE
jgi:putative transposase